MRNKSLIEPELKRYLRTFKQHILTRGKSISKNNILPVRYNRAGTRLETIVNGSYEYEVRLEIDFDHSDVVGYCTCPYMFDCKHLAAMVYSILSGGAAKQTTRSVKEKHTDLRTKLTSDPKTSKHTITSTNLLKMSEDIGLIASTRRKQNYSIEVRCVLIGQQCVMVELLNSDWTSQGKVLTKFHESIINITDSTLEIECPSCTFKKNKLCGFAHTSVEDLLFSQIEATANVDLFDYDRLINEYANELNVTEAYLRENSDIILRNGSSQLFFTDNQILSTPELENISSALNTEKSNRDTELIAALEKSTDYGEAMIWSSPSGAIDYRMFFVMSGKLNKTADRLSSHLKEVDAPSLLSKQAMGFYTDMQQYNFDPNYDQDDFPINIDTKSVIELMKESLPLLQQSINYYFNPVLNYHGYVEKILKKDLNLFQFSSDYYKVRLFAAKEENGYTLKLVSYIGDEIVDLSEVNKLSYNWTFVLMDNVAYIYEDSDFYQLKSIFHDEDLIRFLPNYKDHFFNLLNNLKSKFTIVIDDSIEDSYKVVENLAKKIRLKEVGNHVLFYPILSGDDIDFSVMDVQPVVVEGSVLLPDESEVENYRKMFLDLFSEYDNQFGYTSFVHLSADDYIQNNWHLDFFENCTKADIELLGLDDFQKIRFSKHKAEIKTDLSSKIDWFELNVTLSFGDEKVNRKKWIKALKEGKSYVELSDGTLGILPKEWSAKMTRILSIAEVTGAKLNISKLRFNVLDDLFSEVSKKSVLEEISAKKKLLASYADLSNEKKIPASIKATLRPYQNASFQWMQFLMSSGFGGILADDMGLGKTLQIICLLAQSKEQKKCHALVVVPRSLIFNWVNEIQKFCPSLTSHVHHGTQRHATVKEMKKADVVISTYGTVVNDIEQIRKKTFTHIILDESQAIKNPASKRYKALRLLKSPFKLCATGTPIQNNTFDLYTQASFANPGLLGNQAYFRQNFANPIDKNHDKEASDLLLKMIHPFILRRTKEQVAKDLPEKIESVIYCEMLPHQRKMYEELKEQIRNDLLELSEDDSQLKFKVLDGLLRLRQLCNSPALVDSKLRGKKADSIKIESLIYKLTEEIGEGNALVFSQFVQMLSLIRKELDDRGIPYRYLDGSTRNREAVVASYMEDDDCRIFLISLKAGNTGLNLTKAQYVFLVDPWWNPAAEAQAIDRTHRIGQSKKVFAYKMICKDTIEEKVLQLQAQKKKVASQLIKIDETTFKSMKKNDLLALFD